MVFEPDNVYENLQIGEEEFEKLKCPNIKISGSSFVKTKLIEAKLEKFRLEETKFETCNLANLEAGECNWWQVVFKDCKMTGVRLVRPIWDRVNVEGGNSQYLQFRFGKAKKSKFHNCDLSFGDFGESDLSGCELTNCNLTEADFSGTKLKGTDVRGSNLTGIKIGIAEVKGMVVTTDQAVYLSGLLGIVIKDRQ